MRIDQHTPTITLHDAVSNNVLTLRNILRKHNFKTEIYAENIDPKLNENILHSNRYRAKEKDLLILHVSIGSEFYEDLSNVKSKIMMIYHNITPPNFFLDSGGAIYESAKRGIEQLKKIRPYIDYVAADSRFNARELEELGYKDVKVLSLACDASSMLKLQNDNLKENLKKQTNILFVGRIAPNKCQPDLVKAFYIYNKYFNRNSHLYMVGGFDGMEYYKEKIENLIDRLKLRDNVFFTGKVSEEDKATYFQNSSIYLSMSEHEGFCVPAVESMFAGLPILAYYYSGALPDTANTGAIYFTKKNYFEVAALMDELVNNKPLRKKIIKNQKKELEKFELKQLENNFIELINEAITK